MRIAHLPQGCGIHHPGVTLQESPKSIFGPFCSITAEEFKVFHHSVSLFNPARLAKGTINLMQKRHILHVFEKNMVLLYPNSTEPRTPTLETSGVCDQDRRGYIV